MPPKLFVCFPGPREQTEVLAPAKVLYDHPDLSQFASLLCWIPHFPHICKMLGVTSLQLCGYER